MDQNSTASTSRDSGDDFQKYYVENNSLHDMKVRNEMRRVKRAKGVQPMMTSLASRIKDIREEQLANGNMAHTSENSRRPIPDKLHSLVEEYKHILDDESRLGKSTLKTISEAKSINKQVHKTYSGERSDVPNPHASDDHNADIRTGIAANAIHRRRRVFLDNDSSGSQQATRRNFGETSSLPPIHSYSPISLRQAESLSLPHMKGGGSRVDSDRRRLEGDVLEGDVLSTSEQQRRLQTEQHSTRSSRYLSSNNSLEDVTREWDLRYVDKVKNGIIKPRGKASSLLLQHVMDIADDRYKHIIDIFSAENATRINPVEATVEEPPVKINDTHEEIEKRELSTDKAPEPKSKSTKRKWKVYASKISWLFNRKTIKPCDRHYTFVGVCLRRPYSVPSIRRKSLKNTKSLKTHNNVWTIDMAEYMKTKDDSGLLANELSISQMFKVRESRVPSVLPSQHIETSQPKQGHQLRGYHNTTLHSRSSRKQYLRSQSCSDFGRLNKEFLSSIPRLINLYDELKSIDKFTLAQLKFKMTISQGQCHSYDMHVSWSSTPETDMTLYRDSKFDKPLRIKMRRPVGNGGKPEISKRQKPFLFMDDVPVEPGVLDSKETVVHVCQDKTVSKESKEFPARKYPVSKFHQNCVPRDEWKKISVKTKHHFVPWNL